MTSDEEDSSQAESVRPDAQPSGSSLVARSPSLVVRSEPLGGSPLAKAAIAQQLPDHWIARRPSGPDQWRAEIDRVRARFPDRSWGRELSDAIRATGEAGARLARVIEGNGVLVTTGQQPGLFGGPVYTWSKALSALAIAEEIERCTGVPACALFWAATDDSDFAEGAWTAVAGAGGATRLELSADAPAGIPVSEIPLPNVDEQLEQLTRGVGSAVDPRPLDVARAAYRPGATVGTAYLDLLRALLAPLGVPVLDSSHAAVRARAHPTLQRALTRAAETATAVRQRDREITDHGFSPQVAEVEGLSLVFVREEAGAPRRRVRVNEAARLAATAPVGSLSPNVLLRPIVERSILPTVSYVAGPGELSYFAQVSAAAQALELDQPRAVPRWSTTIVEPHVASILERLGLEIDDLRDPNAAESRIAREATPAATARALEDLARATRESLEGARRAMAADRIPLPGAVVDGVEREVAHRLGRFERRVLASVKRHERERMTAIATARGALFPLGIRQERALNLLPLLARHGPHLLEMMLAAARVHARELVR